VGPDTFWTELATLERSVETHFIEERFELESTTEATVGPTKQVWYIFRRI